MRAGGTQVWRFARPKGSPPPEHLWSDHGRVAVKCGLRGFAGGDREVRSRKAERDRKGSRRSWFFPTHRKRRDGWGTRLRGQGSDSSVWLLGGASFIPWSPNARDQGHPAPQRNPRSFKNSFKRPVSGCGGSTHCFKGCREARSENLLCLWSELFAVAGQVEDVNGGFAFGVDEGNLDVALHG